MILTGKSLEYFNEWCYNKYGTYYCQIYHNAYLNALIIEWFDSVGIYIEILREDGFFTWVIGHHYDTPNSDSRKQTTEQAIIHANKLYNEQAKQHS